MKRLDIKERQVYIDPKNPSFFGRILVLAHNETKSAFVACDTLSEDNRVTLVPAEALWGMHDKAFINFDRSRMEIKDISLTKVKEVWGMLTDPKGNQYRNNIVYVLAKEGEQYLTLVLNIAENITKMYKLSDIYLLEESTLHTLEAENIVMLNAKLMAKGKTKYLAGINSNIRVLENVKGNKSSFINDNKETDKFYKENTEFYKTNNDTKQVLQNETNVDTEQGNGQVKETVIDFRTLESNRQINWSKEIGYNFFGYTLDKQREGIAVNTFLANAAPTRLKSVEGVLHTFIGSERLTVGEALLKKVHSMVRHGEDRHTLSTEILSVFAYLVDESRAESLGISEQYGDDAIIMTNQLAKYGDVVTLLKEMEWLIGSMGFVSYMNLNIKGRNIQLVQESSLMTSALLKYTNEIVLPYLAVQGSIYKPVMYGVYG